MNTSTGSLKVTEYIDVNSPDFYNNIHDETEYDQARIKKSLAIVKELRINAAEMEVKTAALYHAELWRDIQELKMLTEKTSKDDDVDNN